MEALHFVVVGSGHLQPQPEVGTVLKAVAVCDDGPALTVKIKQCSFDKRGASKCTVDVQDGPGICLARSPDEVEDGRTDRGVAVVHGYWDSTGQWIRDDTTVTLACEAKLGAIQAAWADGAISTCLEREYLPNANRDEFLACIRAVRADYCGNGHGQTVEGTDIDMHDNDHHPMSSDECCDGRLQLEATWTAGGAVCVSHLRWEKTGYDACAKLFDDPDAGVSGTHCRHDLGDPVLSTRSRCNQCIGDGGSDCPDHDQDPKCLNVECAPSDGGARTP